MEDQELECVGRMEVKKSNHSTGFMCGSLPVPTPHEEHHTPSHLDALVPIPNPNINPSMRVRAPRYRMLPTETDLNSPPSIGMLNDKFVSSPDFNSLYSGRSGGSFAQPVTKKCEALAVSGLAAYGDEIDVVAPVDIMKQIFKIPYTKSRLSIAVHRIGRTLILNTGPDVEEGEKLIRKKKKQSKGIDESLFLNFAMHSVRAEACDCPPSSDSEASENQSDPTVIPGYFTTDVTEEEYLPSVKQQTHSSWHFINTDEPDDSSDTFSSQSEQCTENNRESVAWDSRHHGRSESRCDAINKARHVSQKDRPQNCNNDSEKHRRMGNEGFLKVLFWQFHNLRMLLGSDLLVFSNEKHVAVSLHLWEVERQATPLMWLDAWLDNVMASVPELAICYHHNGVVQGYELLKTDDIFLLKGISEDGTTIFHPQVIRQNGLSVLKFLQDNCKQDPGTYWLYKNAGEDLMQLFDLSVISKNCPDNGGEGCSSLPSFKSRRKMDYSHPLGILLYRLAHRLSLTKIPNDMSRCAKLFQKCLEFLNGQEHLVIRACAHEQVARLLLKYYEYFGSAIESLLLDCDSTAKDVGYISSADFSTESPVELPTEPSVSTVEKNLCPVNATSEFLNIDASGKTAEEMRSYPVKDLQHNNALTQTDLVETIILEEGNSCAQGENNLAVCQVGGNSPKLTKTVSDPISAKIAAVHHVSQAIKSLRWKRQLQDPEIKMTDCDQKSKPKSFQSQQFPVCVCGDVDCIEVCDIRELLAGHRMDRKLWQLVLLLGESYLALGEAYKNCEQLMKAVNIVELACTVYGAMPASLEETECNSALERSSTNLSSSPTERSKQKPKNMVSPQADAFENPKDHGETCLFGKKGLFWGRAHILIGDIYVECQQLQGERQEIQNGGRHSTNDVKMASEVMKEVKRLKKKLGQSKRNCNICSLTNCSCQSDRASSGNSASSSSGGNFLLKYKRRKNKGANSKGILSPQLENSGSDSDPSSSTRVTCERNKTSGGNETCSSVTVESQEASGSLSDSNEVEGLHKAESIAPQPSKSSKEKGSTKHMNIFDFIEELKTSDLKVSLSVAADCYDVARSALQDLADGREDYQSATRKKGWIFNELGRQKLSKGDLRSAEDYFATAIATFKEIMDITNIVLIYCNLGHGRRALAESLAAKIESYRQCGIHQTTYKETLDEVTFQYGKALKHYSAAFSELTAVGQDVHATDDLQNEVYTQYAHTFLRLGIILAREDISVNVVGKASGKDIFLNSVASCDGKNIKIYQRKSDISGSDAIREALSLYESLGTLRLQEAAFANFQLACCHRDSCIKILNYKGKNLIREKNLNANLQQARRYASLAEKYWQKATEFYHARSHPDMFLQILIERSALCQALWLSCHSYTILESALSYMLEGRHIFVNKSICGQSNTEFEANKVVDRFCKQLQALLKTMLATTCNSGKHLNQMGSVQSRKKKEVENDNHDDALSYPSKGGDVVRLKELYRIALKSDGLPDLPAMHSLWES